MVHRFSMKYKKSFVFLLILLLANCAESGRSSSSSGRSSSSSRSRPSPSYSGSSSAYRPSSYSSPSAPSYGWSVSKPSAPSPSSYGWGSGSPSAKPAPSSSYGWNFGGSPAAKPAPSGPSGSYGWGSSSPAAKPAPSAPSSSYGWNFGGSPAAKPAPSAPSGSYGWGSSSPAAKPAPSAPSGSYGWGSSSPAAKPAPSAPSSSYGWNFGGSPAAKPAPSAPVGPPPAYPGLANRPVSSPNGPPSYSPGYSNPPAYSPSYPSPSYPSASKPKSSPGWFSSIFSPSSSSRQNNYSPSSSTYRNKNTPSYSPSYPSQGYSPSYRTNNYNTHSNYPGAYNTYNPPNYGSQFGSSGLPGNTYIHNNYYGSQGRQGGSGFGSGFLTSALLYGAGMASGYAWGRPSYYGSNSYGSDYSYRERQRDREENRRDQESRRNEERWNAEEDRKWRATTQAPYFQNKVPGATSVLPAAAVVGAATAFGLSTLLPLNVPAESPLMYCNSTMVSQTPIKLGDDTFWCGPNNTIAISCPRTLADGSFIDECRNNNQKMACDVTLDANYLIYCTNATLMTRSPIVCDSSFPLNVSFVFNGTTYNQTETILNCYYGQLPQQQASFIPTTTTEVPVTTTTAKPLSLGAKIHVFFMKLTGQGDVLNKNQTEKIPEITTVVPVSGNETVWIPEALTIPPETSTASYVEKIESLIKNYDEKVKDIERPTNQNSSDTSTTEGPFEFVYNNSRLLENGTLLEDLLKVPENFTKILEEAYQRHKVLPSELSRVSAEPDFIFAKRVIKTAENGSLVVTHEPLSETMTKMIKENNLDLSEVVVTIRNPRKSTTELQSIQEEVTESLPKNV